MGNDNMTNGGSTWIWVFFLFFLLAAGGGNGFGLGNNATANALTQAQLQNDLYAQSSDAAMRDLRNNQCNAIEQVMRSEANLATMLSNNRYDSAMQANAIQNQQMLANCETNRNIDAVRYENAKNTCDIIQAGNVQTQRILDALTANTIQDLRDKLQTEQLERNNAAQTATLISALRPFPQPCYVTCSPYSANTAYNCGCNG